MKTNQKNPQTQLKRTVKRIIASDILKTEIYSNKGLSFDSFTFRPVDVIPQKRDIILGGEKISKSRESLNSKIENYELHLSSADVMKLEKFKKLSNRHSFTIHLPDYQDSTRLLNPFTDEYKNKKESINIIRKVKDFASKLSEVQNDKVTVVASFSPRDGFLHNFYENCQGLQLEFAESGLDIAFQWLPPFAWYFGGSVKLNAFNKLSDVDYILQNNLNICLDTSHLLMSAKYFEYDPSLVLKLLQNQILHFHLADATGIDGEGVHLGQGDVENQDFLHEVLGYPQRKVLEVWQGHLNLYQGFFDAIFSVKDLDEGR